MSGPDAAGSLPRLALTRADVGGNTQWLVRRGDDYSSLGMSLVELLRLPQAEARSVVEAASSGGVQPSAIRPELIRPPVDPQQEIWGAGVTYLRSRDGRMEESNDGDVYDRVYRAARPELFFKSIGARAVGPGDAIGVRADSDWNAPEPELGLVIDSSGDLFGFVPGNDASSRTIEGENPLYLPQAKIFTGSAAIGPEIVPAWTVDGPFRITLDIVRDGSSVFSGETSTDEIARRLADLIDWLFRAMEFPDGVILLTGTGIVPDAAVTLLPGDAVTVGIDGIGTLANTVERVGRNRPRDPLQEGNPGKIGRTVDGRS